MQERNHNKIHLINKKEHKNVNGLNIYLKECAIDVVNDSMKQHTQWIESVM